MIKVNDTATVYVGKGVYYTVTVLALSVVDGRQAARVRFSNGEVSVVWQSDLKPVKDAEPEAAPSPEPIHTTGGGKSGVNAMATGPAKVVREYTAKTAKPYPYIRAWGRMMGSGVYYVNGVIEEAERDQAPETAIYKDNEGVWKTYEGIEKGDVKELIAKYVGEAGVKAPSLPVNENGIIDTPASPEHPRERLKARREAELSNVAKINKERAELNDIRYTQVRDRLEAKGYRKFESSSYSSNGGTATQVNTYIRASDGQKIIVTLKLERSALKIEAIEVYKEVSTSIQWDKYLKAID